jgi:hypothetical protein
MDLSRGRLESFGETFPIVEGWITTLHPDRRKQQLPALPFPDRRRPSKKAAAKTAIVPATMWVAIGHFTVRANETTESFSAERQKLFLMANGIRLEVVYLKPVYVDSRNHKYIYSATKTQRWSFVALCQPTTTQLRMLPVADDARPANHKPKTVLGRIGEGNSGPVRAHHEQPVPPTAQPETSGSSSTPIISSPNSATFIPSRPVNQPAPPSKPAPNPIGNPGSSAPPTIQPHTRTGLSYVAKSQDEEEAKDIAAFLAGLLDKGK